MNPDHDILESYLTSTSLAQQQIESYNRFVRSGIQRIIDSQNKVEPDVANFAIKFGEVRLEYPSIIEADSSTRRILPTEAMARNLTYSAPIYLTYVPLISGIEKIDAAGEAFIGELPVMVKSNLCSTRNMTSDQLLAEGEDPDDPGGYFIIKGTERVLVGVEDLAPNRIMCSKEGNEVVSKVFSTTTTFRARCAITRDQYGIFDIVFPTISKGMDLVLVLRALGISVEDMLALAGNREIKNDMQLNIDQSKAKDMTPNQALLEIGRLSAPNQAKGYQEKRADMQLDTYILPHIGTTQKDRKEKARFLIHMAERASLVSYGHVKSEDKDHYANKRVKLAGDLMEELFSYAFKFLVRDIKYRLERTTSRGRRLTVRGSINADTLTDKILYSMGTGSWPNGQTGISQTLDRVNFVSTIANIRRVKSPLSKRRPQFKARDVHGTHIGKLCPSETTEGTEVGLIKYLSIMSKVTVGAERKMLEDKLKEMKIMQKPS